MELREERDLGYFERAALAPGQADDGVAVLVGVGQRRADAVAALVGVRRRVEVQDDEGAALVGSDGQQQVDGVAALVEAGRRPAALVGSDGQQQVDGVAAVVEVGRWPVVHFSLPVEITRIEQYLFQQRRRLRALFDQLHVGLCGLAF